MSEILPSTPPSEVRTAFLDRYAEVEAEVVLEILADAGIFAMRKEQPGGSHSPYPMHEGVVVLADAARVDEARQVVAERLPEHLESIRAAMEDLDVEE